MNHKCEGQKSILDITLLFETVPLPGTWGSRQALYLLNFHPAPPHHSSQFGLLTLLPSLNKLTLWSTSMKNISRHSGSSEQRYFQSSALGLALKRAVYQRSHFSGKHSFVVKNKVKLTTVSQAPWVFISQPEKYTNLIYLFIIYFVILFPLLTWRLNFTEQCHLKN